MSWHRDLKIGGFLALMLALLPVIGLTSPYYLGIVITALTFVALGLAWNIISGIGGQLSMGHAAYFGLGAYTSSLLLVRLDVTPWIGMFAGAIVAAIFGLCLGYPSFRLKGVYFKLVTFVSALILEIICRSWSDFTGGDPGLQIPLLRNAPLMYQFGSPIPYFYIILIIAAVYFLFTRRIMNSRFGYYLQAIRDDQVAAEVIGVNCLYMKLAGFALSAALTALVGTFYAQYVLFIDPASTFGMFVSVKIALAAIVGGAGTLWGPVMGGLFLIPLAELGNAHLAGTMRGIDVVLYSSVLVITAIFLPRGLVSLPATVEAKRLRLGTLNWRRTSREIDPRRES